MTVEKFCLKCLHEVFYDTTEHHYCCECFAVRTILDEEDMLSLEYVPPHWIETDTIPRILKASRIALEWIDRVYPPLIFTTQSKDSGAVEIARIRENLRAALQELETGIEPGELTTTARTVWPGEG